MTTLYHVTLAYPSLSWSPEGLYVAAPDEAAALLAVRRWRAAEGCSYANEIRLLARRVTLDEYERGGRG